MKNSIVRTSNHTYVFTAFFFFLLLSSCLTSNDVFDSPYGVPPEHASYIPARIAIAPCQAWPHGARFSELPLSNIVTGDLEALCKKMDAFVLDGFKNQPFMKGYSPEGVRRFLTQNNTPDLLDKSQDIWKHLPSDCSSCKTFPAFYLQSIANRQDWRMWLDTFSKSVKKADAVLLPFIGYAYQKSFNDRGLLISLKAGNAVILLVDTGTATLLWSGGRETTVNTQRLESSDVSKPLDPPPWNDLWDRLFTEDLWKDFPGRQVF